MVSPIRLKARAPLRPSGNERMASLIPSLTGRRFERHIWIEPSRFMTVLDTQLW